MHEWLCLLPLVGFVHESCVEACSRHLIDPSTFHYCGYVEVLLRGILAGVLRNVGKGCCEELLVGRNASPEAISGGERLDRLIGYADMFAKTLSIFYHIDRPFNTLCSRRGECFVYHCEESKAGQQSACVRMCEHFYRSAASAM